MANEKRRGYRRGIPYRTGDVKRDDFLKEFKFSDIIYGDEYSENDRKRYLNYTYDALKDLVSILNIPSNVVSLLNREGKKPALVFGTANKGSVNLIVNKDGTLVKNWVYFFDKFLADEGVDGVGLCNSLTSEMNDVYSQELRSVLQVLKFKEKKIDKTQLTSETLENYRNEIDSLIDSMPFKEGAEFDLIATIEDSRSTFLKELSEESLNNMVATFENNGLSLNDIKDRLFDLFEGARTEYNSLVASNINSDLVNTDFYLMNVNRDKEEGLNKYTSNLELFVCAVQAYINNKLKEISCYNNFLVSPDELNRVPVTNEEAPVIYSSIEKFFNTVMPIIADAINVEDVEEVEDAANSEDTTPSETDNIDKIMSEDKGKFKLTLFKKLAKEIGLKVDQSKSEKTDFGVYYIEFTEGYIKYIKPAIYNNPAQKNHCINVYCGDKGNTKHGYWWDYELDYNDLIKFLVELENEHRKENKTEIKKVDKNLDKFKLTEFKTACTKMNLNVDKSETQIIDKKYIVRFNKSYLMYVIVPVYIDSNSKKEHKIKIKTMREEIYHTWAGKLEYKELLLKLLEIEKQGKAALKEEKEELLRKKAEVEKERDALRQKAQLEREKANAAYKELRLKEQKELESLFDCADVSTTKELRDKMLKYMQLNKVSLGYPANLSTVENVLRTNVQNKDGADLIVERTVISDKDLKGNSKVWNKQGENRIQLQNRADGRKQLEGLIEAFVDIKVNSKNYSKVQKQMFRESLTFMISKVAGLDVRTYCTSDLFDRIIKSGSNNMSSYLKQTFKLFNNLIVYFLV